MTAIPLVVKSFTHGRLSRQHFEALSSLPITYATETLSKPDVAIAGPDADSVEQAISSGPKLLVLEGVERADQRALQLLSECGIPAFPVLSLAPVVKRAKELLIGLDTILVRSHFSVEARCLEAQLEHLLALEALLGPLDNLVNLRRESAAYWNAGKTADGARVLWGGQTNAGQRRFDFDAVGISSRVSITASGDRTAEPASIVLSDSAGSRRLRDVYESGQRLFWRGIAAEVTGQPGSAVPLDRALRARVAIENFFQTV